MKRRTLFILNQLKFVYIKIYFKNSYKVIDLKEFNLYTV